MTLGRVSVSVFAVLAAILASACGGGDDDKPPAVQKCEDFSEAWCNRALSCLVSLGTLPESQFASNLSRCIDTAIAAAPCKNAVEVGSDYASCISSIETMDCSAWAVPIDQLSSVPPPSVCNGVIRVSQ